ncbi:acid phosphatase/Vanadium-dependent haloperoxidase [Violaceomyces palustris]|uniref:Acid phosphatase/Vanadium-dependent haloperoxidase n=1 Tax=Violaceomyces palustris TaxID=1673888 RepID=A0ACD0NXT4_9BASI|nr:acid phosphatase/Vanadium-dependent haloperoxidase [Violaceomyces palustris]
MYNDQGQHRDAEPSQSAGNGRVHSRTHSGSNFLSGSELYNSLRWTRERPPTSRKRKIELLRSYLPDWIITIVVAGLFQLVDKVYGFRREFSLTDTSIQHTYAVHERVPVWLLGVLTVLVPALIILFVSLGISRSFWDLHNGLLGLVLAHALTLTITTIIKVCVGRPRPDLLDRCQPRAGSQNASPYGLATEIICTVPLDSSKLKDGFRSFPSGHSSTSFAGMTFLTLYIGAKMHLFDRRGHAITAWLSVLPLVAATLIAVSRTMDYRHHATDVIAGGLLGFWLAYGVYRLYYPSLRHPQCHKPYSPRIPRESLIVSSGQDVERASELGESNNDFRATTQYSEQTRPSDVAAGHYHQPSSDTPGFKRADDMEVDHETVPRI